MNLSVPTRPPSPQRPVAQTSAETAAEILQRRAPRTTLFDRIAMRIGLALLIWGTRPTRQSAPDVSGFRADPRAPLYARHAHDDSLARHALLHGASTTPFGR
ncbi:hypothetical protein [Microbacterium karelineae]|uniref:hypothetical protein n=1 Tax=Microbacterium karelineae TaxID=2654283 RepID=UPI0012EA5752|nr:hypothetical protein [Microbacterium karelineae]